MCSAVNLCTMLLAALSVAMNVANVKCCMFQPDDSVQCERLDQSMCSHLPGLHFNSTSFPNMYGHQSLTEVRQFLTDTPLLLLERLNCSAYTHILICASVFPLCYQKLFERVEPCRELCVAVRESCHVPLRTQAGVPNLDWPSSLNCDRFAPYGTQLCIWNDSSCSRLPTPTPQPPIGTLETETMPIGPSPVCTGHLSAVNNSRAVFGGVRGCVEPCQGTYFEDDHSMLITMWMTAISFLSLIVAILVFFTFLLNYKTVHSLEASIYYITLCYGLLAFTNLLSVAVDGNNIICDPSVQNPYNQSIVVVDGLTSPACSTFFSFSYFFTLCTWSWWVVLALEWALCTLKRTNTSTEWKVVFHALAWGIPFIFLLLSLFTRSFSGKPVLQTCWIRKGHEVAFVLIPLSASILLCSVVIVVIFARVVNLRDKKFKEMRDSPSSTDPPNSVDPSQLHRIGTYITFYLIPMGVLFCTYFYDYWFHEPWEKTYLTCSTSSASLQSCDTVPSSSKPSFQVYMAQALASLCMGFISIFWLLRQRLFLAWRNLCCVLCIYGMKYYSQKPPPQQQQQQRLEPISIQMQNPTALDSEV